MRRRCAVVLAAVVAAWAATSGAAYGQAPAESTRPIVMPFQATSDEPKAEWLGELAAVAVTRELGAAGVPAISRGDRLLAMERLRVPSVPLLSHATVVRLASVVGASTAICRPGRGDGRGHRPAGPGDSRRHRTDGRRSRRARAARRALRHRIAPRPASRAHRPGGRGHAGGRETARGRVRALHPQPRHRQPRHQADAADLGARAGAVVRRGALRALAGVLRSGRASACPHRGGRHSCQRSERTPRGVSRSRVRTPAWTSSRSDGGSRGIASRPARRRGGQRHGHRAAASSRAAVRRRPSCSAKPPRSIPETPICSSISATRTGSRASIRRPSPRCGKPCGAIRPTTTHTTCSARRCRRAAPPRRARARKTWPGACRRPTASSMRAATPTRCRAGSSASRPSSTLRRAPASTRAIAAAGQREQRELAGVYLANGRRLSQAGLHADALVELRRTVFLSPYDDEAHLLIGQLLLRLGRAREAIDALKISVWSRDTTVARAHARRGVRRGPRVWCGAGRSRKHPCRRAGEHRHEATAERPPSAVARYSVGPNRARMSATNPCQMKDFTRFS